MRDRIIINNQRNIEEKKKKKQKNERKDVIHLHSLYIFATTYGPIGTCFYSQNGSQEWTLFEIQL